MHRRYFLPPLSLSQPVIADENIVCWGTFLKFFAFFAPQAQHSTAQRSQLAQAAKQVRADQSATTQASRQSWLEPACRRAFIQLAVFKPNEEIEICSAYKRLDHSQSSYIADVIMLPVHLLFSPSFLFRPCMRRLGCFRGPWSSWHLQVASLHLKPRTSLSASLIRIFFQCFLVSERSGRRKPPAERSALHTTTYSGKLSIRFS